MRTNRSKQGARWLLMAAVMMLAAQAPAAQDPNQRPGLFGPASSSQALLAQMVKRSSVIFAGEIYGIRAPQEGQGGVEVLVRVDQGVRGVETGRGFILHLPRSAANGFREGGRYMLLLGPPDATGMSAPVGGSLGILPVDEKYEVDLSRLRTAVEPAAGAAGKSQAAKTNDGAAGAKGQIESAVEDGAGSPSATGQSEMPELEQSKVAFLAMLRDLFVLSADPNPIRANPGIGGIR